MSQPHARRTVASLQPGFSIIELLVVILIIGVIIALVVPALGGVRDTAKKTETESLCTQLSQAMNQFQTDQKRLPGYFTPAQMGQTSNLTRGMSATENIMLDLMGSKVSTTAQSGWLEVGPSDVTANNIYVDPDGLTGAKSYFTVSAKYYTAQTTDSAATARQAGLPGHTGPASNRVNQLPDLVDAFGAPILVWVQDDAATGNVDPAGLNGPRFVSEAYEPRRANSRAKFYWASNAAFLQAKALGKKSVDMTATGAARQSFLSRSSGGKHVGSLGAYLGSTTNPGPNGQGPSNWTSTSVVASDMFPTTGRGSFVIHSAGQDGIYMGLRATKGSRGAAYATGADDMAEIVYGNLFKDAANAPRATAVDIRNEFDDFLSVGN